MSHKHYNNYSKSYGRPVEPDTVVDEVETVVDDIVEETNAVINEIVEVVVDVIGVVSDCAKLNMRSEPNAGADIVCVINCGTEVVVDESESTDEFYRVCTASGMEGYCMRKYISVNP